MATVPQFPAGTLARSALNTFVTETTTNITDTNVAAGANIAISKTALGTYTAWGTWTITPTSIGIASTEVARYMQIGRQVTCYFSITCDATATFNGYLSLPVAAKYVATEWVAGSGSVGPTGSPNTPITISVDQASRVHLSPYVATGFANKVVTGTFTYEAA